MSETPTPIESATEPPAPAAEGGKVRKAPRLPLEFTVVVRYENAGGEMIRNQCKTASVCVNGALLTLPGSIRIGQALQLTNVKTSQEVPCIVRSVREQEKDNTTLVGVEFAEWLPEFWEILFPREADDPPPSLQPEKPRPEKPFFGRAGKIPEKSAAVAVAAAAPVAPERPAAVAAKAERAAGTSSSAQRIGKAVVAFVAVVAAVFIGWLLMGQ